MGEIDEIILCSKYEVWYPELMDMQLDVIKMKDVQPHSYKKSCFHGKKKVGLREIMRIVAQ